MDDMAVVLGFFVEYYPYVVAIPAEIVACQVHQHYMFCVFFRISQKSFRQFLVFDGVSRAACGAGNRVDIRLSAFHFAMRFGWRAEDAVAAEIEIEQVGRGVDASQSTIHFEVVTRIRLDKPSGKHNLEDISPQAMGDAFAYVCLVFFVGDGAGDRAGHREIVWSIVTVFNGRFQLWQIAFFSFSQHLYQSEFILKVIEDDDILI